LLVQWASIESIYVCFKFQVTKFTCGGFTLGICSTHVVFDGLGFAQFLKAVGEMARGLQEPTVKPVWFRDIIPDPPKVPHAGPPPSFTIFNFATSVVDISLDSINRIKKLYLVETGQRSSTFEVVTAMILKCRARAIDLAPEAEVRLGFAASTRHLLHHVLPSVEGYYGNCVYPVAVTISSKEINNASLVAAISVIKSAKDALSTKFLDWMYGRSKSYQTLQLDYGTMVVTDWSKVGFNDVDFGWGKPKYVVPLNDDFGFIASAIYLKPPLPKQGIRLMLRCVKEEHSAVFSDELSKLLV
jgi:Transferase family